jgi:hypothetical protein
MGRLLLMFGRGGGVGDVVIEVGYLPIRKQIPDLTRIITITNTNRNILAYRLGCDGLFNGSLSVGSSGPEHRYCSWTRARIDRYPLQ